jgi:hypothetical protein
VVVDVRQRQELLALQQPSSAGSGSGSGSRLATAPGQRLCPLLEPILYLVTACERCMGGNLTELGLLLGIPLELPREDIMEIAEDFNDSDREVRHACCRHTAWAGLMHASVVVSESEGLIWDVFDL